MEFEDSRKALFVDPNAYIQNYNRKEKSQPKKIVFAEPYENIPNFYINNNFKKKECDCASKAKEDKCCDSGFGKEDVNHNCSCKQYGKGNNGFFKSFNLQNLLPLLSVLNKNDVGGISNIMSMFNTNNTTNSGNNIIANLLSQPDLVTNITKLFTGGGLNFLKNKQTNKEIDTTDYEIKNYTRVD